MMKHLAIATMAAACLALAGPAGAQGVDYAQRARDLEGLSRIFGELHHIRRMCNPRGEAEVWRNRMRRLIDLEQPQQALRDNMVAAFNTGFREGERRYAACDRDARDRAAALAADGDAMTRRLAAPLYEALAQSGGAEGAWRSGEND